MCPVFPNHGTPLLPIKAHDKRGEKTQGEAGPHKQGGFPGMQNAGQPGVRNGLGGGHSIQLRTGQPHGLQGQGREVTSCVCRGG